MERVYKTLQRRYSRAKVHYGKGLTEKGETKKVSDIFVRLMVLEREALKLAFKNRSFGTGDEAGRKIEHAFNALSRGRNPVRTVELSDIFPQNSSAEDDSYRVLLLASAGCGKTTLMTKYCPYMWVESELWSGQFDLVICGELRSEEIRQARGIGDLLGGWSDLGVESIEERQRIVDFVSDYPHRICLVLDGLDETSFDSCSDFVKGVLRGEKLSGIRLVLTSRPCDDVFNLCEAYPFSQRLELVGFLPEDVEEYVKRVSDEKTATKLLRVISEDPYMASVMTTPYFAARVCELAKWSDRTPRCMSDIFELMILQIAATHSMKSYNTWDELPATFVKEVLDLGEFAFRMLVDQQLCFTESEMKKHALSKEAISLGMLVTCEPGAAGRERQYRFSHLMLQEYLSALFVALAGRLCPDKIVNLVAALGTESGHLNMFWQFLASHLDGECMNCLCESLFFPKYKLCIPEAQLESLLFDRNPIPTKVQETLCSHLSVSSMELVAGRLLEGLVEGNVVTAVENEMQCSRSSSNSDFFKAVLSMWLRLSPKGHVDNLLENVRDVDSCAAEACCEVAGIRELVDISVGMISLPFYTSVRGYLVYRCFSEYALHCTSRLTSPGSIPCISKLLASGIYVGSMTYMSAVNCYALEQVVKHHSSDITDIALEMGGMGANVYSLCARLLQCPNLNCIHWETSFGRSGIYASILTCISRNVSVTKVNFGTIDLESLPACATAMSYWPSLREIELAVDEHNEVDREEAEEAFLSAVATLRMLKTVNIILTDGDLWDLYQRLLESSAYPSNVTLNASHILN